MCVSFRWSLGSKCSAEAGEVRANAHPQNQHGFVARIQVVEDALPWYATETYGSDTTFYVASRVEDEPEDLPKVTPG